MISTLRFVSLGHGHVACANNIWAVVKINTAQNRRILARAKAEDRYLDWTAHKPMKALVLMDNGSVIGSSFSVATIFGRLNKACEYDVTRDLKLAEEDDDED